MAKGSITIKVESCRMSRWQQRFADHLQQKNVKKTIHDVYAEMTNRKFTPYRTGALVATTKVTDKNITWGNGKVPYAHYLWQGDVYGPNIPIGHVPNPYTEGWGPGDAKAWYTPKGTIKYPTGRRLIYNRSINKFAQHHWNLAVARSEMEQYTRNVTRWLKKIAKEEGW